MIRSLDLPRRFRASPLQRFRRRLGLSLAGFVEALAPTSAMLEDEVRRRVRILELVEAGLADLDELRAASRIPDRVAQAHARWTERRRR